MVLKGPYHSETEMKSDTILQCDWFIL